MPGDRSRRSVLAGLGASALSLALEGCLRKAPPFSANCPSSPHPSEDLTIDAHCHIFNGSDLQAAGFLIKIQEHGQGGEAVKIAAELLQDLAWSNAPSGREELRVLKHMLSGKDGTSAKMTPEDHRNSAYLRAKKSILNTNRMKALAGTGTTSPSGANTRPTAESVGAQIRSGLQAGTYDEYLQRRTLAPVAKAANESPLTCKPDDTNLSVDGLLDYVVHNFHYRYVMVQDYLTTFASNSGRCVDLLVASMVDYDWWLANGKRTKTPLKTQVAVMEQISILSRGLLHGLVPYDPFREVAFLGGKGRRNDSSLALVQDAVRTRGFLGVKLYPPMGFAPLGNAGLGDFWKGLGLPSWTSAPVVYADKSARSFGERLDEAMRALYQWCWEEEVPILAHSRMSYGPSPQFEALAGADYWGLALGEFPHLRISFGHLGDFSDNLNQSVPTEAVKFLKLMGDAAGSVGEHAFGDSGYYATVLTQEACLTERLKSFYSALPEGGRARIADRLMYGTDWNLLLNQGDIKDYFARFAAVFAQLNAVTPVENGRTAGQRFFGYNAAAWMGLRDGKARGRLEDFYRRNGVGVRPRWMGMVG